MCALKLDSNSAVQRGRKRFRSSVVDTSCSSYINLLYRTKHPVAPSMDQLLIYLCYRYIYIYIYISMYLYSYSYKHICLFLGGGGSWVRGRGWWWARRSRCFPFRAWWFRRSANSSFKFIREFAYTQRGRDELNPTRGPMEVYLIHSRSLLNPVGSANLFPEPLVRVL